LTNYKPKSPLSSSAHPVRAGGHVLATCLPASQTLRHYALSNSPVKIIFSVASSTNKESSRSQGRNFRRICLVKCWRRRDKH